MYSGISFTGNYQMPQTRAGSIDPCLGMTQPEIFWTVQQRPSLSDLGGADTGY